MSNEEFIQKSDHPSFYRFLIEELAFKVKEEEEEEEEGE